MTDRIFSEAEAATYLRCTPRHLQRQRAAGRLKFLRMGRRGIRYRESALEEYLTGGA